MLRAPVWLAGAHGCSSRQPVDQRDQTPASSFTSSPPPPPDPPFRVKLRPYFGQHVAVSISSLYIGPVSAAHCSNCGLFNYLPVFMLQRPLESQGNKL